MTLDGPRHLTKATADVYIQQSLQSSSYVDQSFIYRQLCLSVHMPTCHIGSICAVVSCFLRVPHLLGIDCYLLKMSPTFSRIQTRCFSGKSYHDDLLQSHQLSKGKLSRLHRAYRMGQIKRHHYTILLVTIQCMYKIHDFFCIHTAVTGATPMNP